MKLNEEKFYLLVLGEKHRNLKIGPSVVKPGFHMIVTIVWIAVNDSSDPDRCDRWWTAGIEQG